MSLYHVHICVEMYLSEKCYHCKCILCNSFMSKCSLVSGIMIILVAIYRVIVSYMAIIITTTCYQYQVKFDLRALFMISYAMHAMIHFLLHHNS